MGTIVGLNDLADALIRVGYNLVKPHSSTAELLTLLDETESLLRNVGQDQPLSMQNALIPSKTGLVSVELMNHPDSDVRVSVVTCLTEILRIAAPEAPYSDDEMKEIFRLTVEAFEKLADASSRSYKKAESVLDSVSKVRSCLVMLDLECYDLILQMFRSFFKIIRSDHSRAVFSAMEMIMILVIDETEEISNDLLDTLLASVKKENQTLSPMSWSLGEKVLSRCAHRLKPYIIEALKSAGTSLDMYSPVVTTVCQSVHTDPPKIHDVVNTEVNEAAEPKLGRQVAPRDSSEDKLDLEHARKESRSKSSSKRPVREGTHRIRINGNGNIRNGNNSNLLKQSLKEVRSESTDAEAELGITGKSGRRVKPNSLMNPDEGYDIPCLSGKRESLRTSSNTKLQIKGSGGESSLRKVATKKRPLPKETSPATSSRALTGSVKRSRVTIDESDHDLDSLSSPRLKKLASCFRDEVPREKESSQESDEIPEDDEKIGNSSKKTRSQNGLEKSQKTAQKKPIVEAKIVNSSGKRTSARTEAKRKNSEAASQETPVPQSSKSKKMVSQVAARQVAEESEKTSKSHPTRNRTARKEVESDTNGFGEDLVGKRVNIWWPLDKRYYEGVVESYSSRKKLHRVVYLDGDSEALNLVKERWELLEEDHTSDSEDMEIDDLPESIPLINLMKRQKLKKSKNAGVSVEPTSSSGVRSSSRTVTKKDSGKKGNKQAKRGKGASKAAVVIEKPEKTREGKNLKSLKELNAETERTEEQEVDHDNEVDDYSDKQEQSEDKSEEESLKSADTEAESKEEDKQSPTSEAESERKSSESEEEPKWRDTDDMEVEAEEEKEEVSDKGTDTNLSETDKEEDEEERDMEDEAGEVDGKVTNTNLSETDKEDDEEERDVEEEAEEREEEVDDKVTNTKLSETDKEEDEERAMEDDAEEVDDKVINTSLSEIEKEEGEEKDMEDEATEREEVDGKVSEIEKEEDEERALEAEAEEGDDKVSEIEKEEDEVRAMEAEAEEGNDKVSEIEKEEDEVRAMEAEAEEVDDKVTNTNLSEIEKEEEEERRDS